MNGKDQDRAQAGVAAQLKVKELTREVEELKSQNLKLRESLEDEMDLSDRLEEERDEAVRVLEEERDEAVRERDAAARKGMPHEHNERPPPPPPPPPPPLLRLVPRKPELLLLYTKTVRHSDGTIKHNKDDVALRCRCAGDICGDRPQYPYYTVMSDHPHTFGIDVSITTSPCEWKMQCGLRPHDFVEPGTFARLAGDCSDLFE